MNTEINPVRNLREVFKSLRGLLASSKTRLAKTEWNIISNEIKLKPIGSAKNKEAKHVGGWAGVITDIIIDEQYQDALFGLSDYSHLIVIYWMHEVNKCELKHVPQGKVGIVPEVGIFACRCPHRPNPIGVSTVKLLGINNNIIIVEGLDVINNTPIFDIKPYTPQYDVAVDAKVPDWVNKLDY